LPAFRYGCVVSTCIAALTTTHWVIYRVHDHTTDTGTTTQPTTAAGLTGHLLIVLAVSNASNGCKAGRQDHAHLTTREGNDRVLPARAFN